jgi:oxalate decarboxylase/phosphoglucose isomerase-like protein (cupin superfamily)
MAAQQPEGIKRTDLQQHDLSVPRPRGRPGPRRPRPDRAVRQGPYPGEEIIYVLEGSLEYQIQGQPTTTVTVGDVLFVPAGAVHAVRNVGSGNAAELATYVVEKGQPILTLVECAPTLL